MTDSRLEIFSITFDDDSVVMAYMRVPEDVRNEGLIGLQHHIRLDMRHPDYSEDASLLRRMAERALVNALEDFHDGEPWVPEEEDDDDEKGMGDD